MFFSLKLRKEKYFGEKSARSQNFASQKKTFLFFSLIFAFFLSQNLYSEIIKDYDFGFSLDIPEGYELSDRSEDGMSLLFSHSGLPVTLVIKISVENQKSDSSAVMKNFLTKLSAQYDADSFEWAKQKCGIAFFKMNLDQNYEGRTVCVPLKPENSFLTLLCYAPSNLFNRCERFIISTLNSLSTDFAQNQKTPGIFVSYAFPKEGDFPVSLKIAGKTINVKMDKSDFEAAKFVVDFEFSVLALYANHNLWKEAWTRYYRRIYADSAARLSNVSCEIRDALWDFANQKNPENPDIAFAQFLLSWVQSFKYQRELSKDSADFTPLPQVLAGVGNDCDSRSMLIAVLLNNSGYDSIMLISREYSHAMVATDISAPGQKYYLKEKSKEYILGETTAKVNWGTIAQDKSDRNKFIPVIFNDFSE